MFSLLHLGASINWGGGYHADRGWGPVEWGLHSDMEGVRVLVLPLTSCVSLGRWLTISELQLLRP